MATGNTYGLGEISHYGAFQRVGGKAGGFINKKFFHPSNLRNQEKLWLAMTADEREQKKQGELEKRREEERQVEELRKQAYLSGQGKATDIAFAAQAKEELKLLGNSARNDVKVAIDEQNKRRRMLRKQHLSAEAREALALAEGDSSDDGEEREDAAVSSGASGERVLAISRYEEEVHVRGHSAVWGSWYSEEDKQWGFKCCKVQEFAKDCPLAPVEEEPAKAQTSRKRRRKGDNAEAEAAAEDDDGSIAGPAGGLQVAASSASAATGNVSTFVSSLIDGRLLQAAEKRKEEKKAEDRQKEIDKTSGYLADLLLDPTA